MPWTSVQTSFLGGEWSKFSQGRFDLDDYKNALNVCVNSFPLEEGAWTRRPGERYLGTTRSGNKGRLISFDFEALAPYMMEFTGSHIRFIGSKVGGPLSISTTNDDLSIVSISSDTPAVVKFYGSSPWQTGDQIIFNFPEYAPASFCSFIRNRVFSITKLSDTDYSLRDPTNNLGINGSKINWVPLQNVTASRIQDLDAPYAENEIDDVRSIQADIGSIILHGSYAPQLVSVDPPTETNYAEFSISPAQFVDGPYLDPFLETTVTPSGLSGTIDLTLSSTSEVQISGIDIGRHVRLLSEPEPWSSGASYSAGDSVAWQGTYYTAEASNTGSQPDLNVSDWSINTSAATWTWGKIVDIVNGSTFSVQIIGPALLYTHPIVTWRVGVFSDRTGWPKCGTYYEGRLWLSGAIANRIDSSVSNDTLNFAPTAADGTVADNNGISYIFNANDVNPIFWMQPTSLGIVCGTQAGEWLIQASALNDPLTPTSIQAHRQTRYGCANIEPRETGLTIAFVQQWKRKLYEYFADVFTGRYTAPNLSKNAAHITHNGIAEIAFQRERTPILWARLDDGELAGVTYKRDTLYSSQGPNFVGWHRHALGSGRTVESICTGPSQFNNLDGLGMVTNDASGVRHVSVLTDIFDEGDLIQSAWMLDDAVIPSGGVIDEQANTVTFYGLWHLEGKSVGAFSCGLDLGDYTVSNGAITVPLGDGIQNLYSVGFIKANDGKQISNAPGNTDLGCPVDILVNGQPNYYNIRYVVPVVVGFNYVSQGQVLRDMTPQEAGTRAGPALAKIARTNQFGAMIVNGVTKTVKFGTDFDHLRVSSFKTAGGKRFSPLELYSDIWWDTLDDSYGFSSMIAWQIDRPLPLTLAAVGGFANTEDR